MIFQSVCVCVCVCVCVQVPAAVPSVSCLFPWCLGPPFSAYQFQGCRGNHLPVPPSFCLPALETNGERRI